MKKTILLFAALLFFALCNAKGTATKKFEYTDNVSVAGVSKEVLFNRASMWIHETFKQQDVKIKIQDKAAGVIYGDITVTEKKADASVTFSLTLNIKDGQYLYIFNNYTNNAGNFNNANPDCCVSGRKWKSLKAWANTLTQTLIKTLADKMNIKSAGEDFLTVPLQDTARTVQANNSQAMPLHRAPLDYYIKAGGAYAPGIFNKNVGTIGGYRHHGNNGPVVTPDPISMYNITLGIFIPSRTDPFAGFGFDMGYFAFPLVVKQQVSSTPPVENTITTNVAAMDFYPHYDLRSRKKRNYSLYTEFGLDFALTSGNAVSDMAGLKIEEGYGRNGFYLSFFVDYTINNIYGAGGRSSTSIKPLFLGLNLSFHPKQNGGTKKIFK